VGTVEVTGPLIRGIRERKKTMTYVGERRRTKPRGYYKRYKVYKSNTTILLWNTGSSKWQHISAFYSNKAIRSSRVT